jgi:lipopolysaccharide transport system permease protein
MILAHFAHYGPDCPPCATSQAGDTFASEPAVQGLQVISVQYFTPILVAVTAYPGAPGSAPDPLPDAPPLDGLPPRSIVADLGTIVRNLLRYRELLVELTRRDLRIRYTQAVMGVLWAILTPLVVALSGWVIRVALSYMSGQPLAQLELAGIAVKAVAWSFFAGALGFGTGSVIANLALVTKVYFPRQILPLSSVATQVVDSAIGAAALAILLPLFGVRPSIALLWIPLLAVLLILLTTGFTLLAACANVFFRDAKHVVQLITSFGIFFTPVIFNADAFGPGGVKVLMLNPLGPVLEGFRLAVVHGHNLMTPLTGAGGVVVWSPWYLVWSFGWALAGTVLAALVFHRAEAKFAEYV